MSDSSDFESPEPKPAKRSARTSGGDYRKKVAVLIDDDIDVGYVSSKSEADSCSEGTSDQKSSSGDSDSDEDSYAESGEKSKKDVKTLGKAKGKNAKSASAPTSKKACTAKAKAARATKKEGAVETAPEPEESLL
jgi:hypothetical protein